MRSFEDVKIEVDKIIGSVWEPKFIISEDLTLDDLQVFMEYAVHTSNDKLFIKIVNAIKDKRNQKITEILNG